jgi:hypothetical protein
MYGVIHACPYIGVTPGKQTMKTSELTGAALDWVVAKCEGLMQGQIAIDGVKQGFYKPSTDWAQGGLIIEREKIDLFTEKGTPESWVASIARFQNGERLKGWRIHQYGPTPLIAAMRCYVASKLGDQVELPNELKGE